MEKAWNDLEKALKKLKPKLKKIGWDPGDKLKDNVIDAVNRAWDDEDDMIDAVKKAVEDGTKGKKPDDFMNVGDFAKAEKAWRNTLKDHKKYLNDLESHCKDARKEHDAFKKVHDTLQKEIKKSRQAAQPKDKAKLLDEAEDALDNLKAASELYGTLKVPEVFYAAKEDRTLAMVVKKVVKKAAGKDLPKILEEKNAKKSLSNATALGKSVDDNCKQAEDAAYDVKKRDKHMKLAKASQTKLKKLNDSFIAAAKKQKKEIEAAPNAKDLKKIIDDIAGFAKDADEKIKKTENQFG